MILNSLITLQPNNTPIGTVPQKNDITVGRIIAIITIAIIVTLIAACVIICLYNKTNNNKKAVKYIIAITEIVLIVIFIACGYSACTSLA